MPQLCRGKLDLSTFQKRSCLGKLVFHRWKVSFPPLVPPLELKSSPTKFPNHDLSCYITEYYRLVVGG